MRLQEVSPAGERVPVIAAAVKPAVAKRGTYCERPVRETQYRAAHRCERNYSMTKVGSAWYCGLHARMKREGRLK